MNYMLKTFLVLCSFAACRGQYLYKDLPIAADLIKEYHGEESAKYFDYNFPAIVEFYSPHCRLQSHCKHFASTYVQIAEQTQKENSKIKFYAVSCGSHIEYCQKVGIRAYPTFYKIDESKQLQYVKSGTRGMDHSFVLSLFDKVQTVNDTSDRFKASVTKLIQAPDAGKPPKSTAARLGASRLNVESGKVEEVPSSGATLTMKANIVGTPEQLHRRDTILESIRRTKGKRKAEQVKTLLETTEVLPFQKIVPLVSVREKLPFIRRTVKLSLEEELIIDTATSFVYSMQHDVFLKNSELSDSETKALKDWLILLSVSLPPEWALTALVDEVLGRVDELAKNPALLKQLLKGQRVTRNRWSPACSKHGGFSCGFWKLMHTVTVGVAEHWGGKTVFTQSTNMFSPAEAADIIREFIANFFRCRECAAHFIASYDDCSYERCSRLIDEAEDTSDSDWKELAIWLWKFHNGVNIRVWNERNNKGVHKPEDEIKVIWPSLSDCWTCYRPDGSWDEDAIFLHLERSYWPGAEIDSRTARLLSFASQIQPPNSIRAFALGCLLLLLVGYRSVSSCVRGAIRGPKRAD